ncbi:MAG TPA: PKD domain-containing protein, partial [Thermoanaerobaculia bacterium]
TSAGVLSFAGPAAVGTIAIPDFQVPKTNLVSAGMRVRLTLSTTAPFTGACAGLQDSAAVSAPLSPPDPRVIQSGDCQGTPCTFTASSLSGIDTVADNWTYQWQVVKSNNNEADNNAFTAASTTGSTFTPTFIKTGSFNVRLTVTNATGSKLLDTSVTINTAAAPCPHMTDSSYVLGFTGKSTGCNKFSSCTSGETVTFSADFPLQGGYDPTCAVHSYTWSIPGSASQTTNTPTVDAVVTSSGTVTVLVNNGNESHSYSTSLTVGSSGGGGGGGGGGGNTNPCGTMGTSNIFITFSGNQGCVTGGTCKNNENLTFNVSPSGYSFSCASHAFNWNFGDGATASAQTPSHAFTTSGSHTVSLQIINAWQTFNKTIPVTTSDSTGGGTCQAMNTNSIAIAYSAVSGCSSNNATACKNGESVQFDVTSFTGYDFSCSNHTFSWNFGDGGTANIKSPTHTFSASGAHNVSVTITNPQTPSGFTRQLTMQTTAGGTGTCGTIVPNISIFIDYNNPTSTCGPLGGSCGTGEVISFTVRDYGAYDSSCAAHTYDWNFGDNSAHGSGKDVTHQYAAGGTFTVTCIVNNTSQTVTLTQAISIGGNPGGPDVKVDPVSTPVVGEAHAFMFSVTVTGAPASAVYVWDLGDGTTKTRTNSDPFKYTYEKSGKYTVTVKVYSNSSQTQLLKTQTFTVNDGTAKRRSVRH